MMAFDELALAYDNAIDWEQRLNRELPLLLSLVAGKGKVRVLDLACGSGRHAVALAQKGFKVVGLDSSKSMIEAARLLAQTERVEVDFLVADMVAAKEVVLGEFNLVTCIGNSLALLASREMLEKTIVNAHSLLEDGGAFVAQMLNFAEIRRSGFRFFPLKGGFTNRGTDVVFTRFFESIEGTEKATLMLTSFLKQDSEWTSHISKQQVLQLDKPILERALRLVGFSQMKFYSSYASQPFQPEESRNIVSVATR